jgi:hypothetical protein
VGNVSGHTLLISVRRLADTSSGEVCQAFLDGECNAGSECKFAHPVEDDEDEEPYTPSEPSTPPYYDPIEHYSPLSPLYPNHFVHWQTARAVPVPVVPFTTPAFSETRMQQWESAPLGGNTLRFEENSLITSDEIISSSSVMDASNVSARGTVRPMSTPPSVRVSWASNVRVSTMLKPWELRADVNFSCSRQKCHDFVYSPVFLIG